MAHFAHVTNGIVDQVIVIDQETLNTGLWGNPAEWIQTSYNTSGGVHNAGGTPLRKNFAGIGYIYDRNRDAFYAPSPYPSWVLDEATCIFNAPKPMPMDEKPHVWDEATLSWLPVKPPVPPAVSARQIRQALTQVGLRDQVEAAVVAGDQGIKDWYQFANDFECDNEHVIAMCTVLGVTEQQRYDLWALAGSL